ncbi:ion channel [Roseovarius phycicola]|uniref:Ion channel n=1 Tax=Roseovarius phycicola TaxID=3080976 RepID=A0ABZ2HC03_9RHOB
MSVLVQIALGSLLLIICGLLHIAIASWLVSFLISQRPMQTSDRQRGTLGLISLVFGAFALSHTLQVYIWAAGIWIVGALPGYEASIYFALVTYTTVGYGDVTLGPDHRIFGAMASVTGILMFGLTTAFLVGVFARATGTERE